MEKQECLMKLNEIAEYKYGWDKLHVGNAFSPLLIDRCKRMLDKMDFAPDIRPTIEDAVVFDFDCKNTSVEISISDSKIIGFVSDMMDNPSEFQFDSETDAVNFWNTIVGALSCETCSCKK